MRLAFYDINIHLLWVLIVKRPLSAANFMEKHAETPHVSFKTGSNLFENFRRYVVSRATVSISFAIWLQLNTKAKVHKLAMARAANHDILRFHISVHDSL